MVITIKRKTIVVFIAVLVVAGGFLGYQKYTEPPTPHISRDEINKKAGPPDREEMTKRLLFMSQEGLIPRRLSLRDAEKITNELGNLSVLMYRKGENSPLVFVRMMWFHFVTCKLLTGLSLGEIERLPAPW